MKASEGIIRNCYTIYETRGMKLSDQMVEKQIERTRLEAIAKAKMMGWRTWDLYESFNPHYSCAFIEAPLVDKRDFSSWKEVLAWGYPCQYQVILYRTNKTYNI